jgi:endo-1,4-beta-mannosidase
MAKYLPGMDEFSIGVNYWASNAGTKMWSKFSLEEIDADFAALKSANVNTVRIFPLWSDFQPIMEISECSNSFRELGFLDGSPLPATGLKSYGLDPEMLNRFRQVANLATKHNLKLIVGLLTGWMSGGMFIPPALAGKNLIENFRAIRIAQMFLKGFVNEMKDHPAIVAWEPGNECNCLSSSNADCAWNWLNMVTSTIKLCDPTRPVYSGMHGGKNSLHKSYDLITQGKLCDALTTHPYPAFTAHCGKSALNTIPAIYHATAESLYYAGVSGKMTFIEEIGAFGPGYLSTERTNKYLYTQLYSALVHDLGSVLWWCGFSFDRCANEMPYRWGAMERELGALKSNRSFDGAAQAMKRFGDELATLPKFSSRKIDAVVVLSTLDDAWKTAYGAFILSKQAGFEIEYCNIASIDTLPESKFYIVPSIRGFEVMDVHKYHLLLEAAKNGATVVFTADSGFLQPFDNYFGATVDYRTQEPETTTFTLDGKTFATNQSITRRMIALDCEVLAKDENDYPVILTKDYGKGKLVFVNAALENNALNPNNDLYLVYRKLATLANLTLPNKSKDIGVTCHQTTDGKTLKFYINYSDEEVDNIPGNSVKYIIE